MIKITFEAKNYLTGFLIMFDYFRFVMEIKAGDLNRLTVFVGLCHLIVCYADVLHSNDVIFIVKVHV
jgi:hypothetical protein